MLLEVLLQNVPPQDCQQVTIVAQQSSFTLPLFRDIERYTVTAKIAGGTWSLNSLQWQRDKKPKSFITASNDGFTLPSFGIWDDQIPVVLDFLERFPMTNQVNVSYGTTKDGRNIIQHDLIMQIPDAMAEIHIQIDENPYNLAAQISGELNYGEYLLQNLNWETNFDDGGRPILEKLSGRVKKGPELMFFQIEHAYAWSECY